MNAEVETTEQGVPTGKQAVNYNITDGALAELKVKYEHLTKLKRIPDKETYEEVRLALRDVRGVRTGIDTRRKELNTDALDWQRRVNTEAKRIVAKTDEIEGPLKALKATEDNRVAAEKAAEAKDEEDRKTRIRAAIEEIRNIPRAGATLDEMKAALKMRRDFMVDDAKFQELTAEADHALDHAVEQLEAAVLERIEFEKQQAELKERQQAQEEEDARRAKQREEEDAARQKQQDEDDARRAEEQAKLDADKKAHEDKVERERIAQEEREKAQREAKEKAEREERERKEREEAARQAKIDHDEALARAKALAPDREKAHAWADSVWKLAEILPDVSDADIKSALGAASNGIYDALQELFGATKD